MTGSNPSKITVSINGENFFRLTYEAGEREAGIEFNTRPKSKGSDDLWKKVSIENETNKREFIKLVNYWLTTLDTKEIVHKKMVEFKDIISSKNIEIKKALSTPDLPQPDLAQQLQNFIVHTINLLRSLGMHDEEYAEEIEIIKANNEAIANVISLGDFSQESKNRIKIYIDSTNKCLTYLRAEKATREETSDEAREKHQRYEMLHNNLMTKTDFFNSIFSPNERVTYYMMEEPVIPS
jgi:hypothetical protein